MVFFSEVSSEKEENELEWQIKSETKLRETKNILFDHLYVKTGYNLDIYKLRTTLAPWIFIVFL